MLKKLVFLFIVGLLVSFMISIDVSANNSEGGLFVVTASSGLHLRSGPSAAHSSRSVIPHGTMIEVTRYVPGGFSPVVFGYLSGYVSSEWIERLVQNELVERLPQLITTAPLNFRSGPSTDHSIINGIVIPTATTVTVVSYNPNGFSNIIHNGQTGYIYTRYTRRPTGVTAVSSGTREPSSTGRVELLHWNEMRRLITNGDFLEVMDVRTGLVYVVRAFSVGGHVDVEPISQMDTDEIKRAAGGRWSWDARPVIVTVTRTGRSFAAAIHSMPHAGSTIRDNGMDGHLCIHFLGVVTRNIEWTQTMQDAVHEAYRWARANGR